MKRSPVLKMAEKEKKIIDAAITIISEKGFSASTTSEIAQMAGVAEGTIFRYFKTKKDILRGIVIHLVKIMGEPLILDSFKKMLFTQNQQDLRSIIKALLKERLALMEVIYPMLRIVVTEAMYHEDIRKILYEEIVSKALNIFKLFREEMVAKGLMAGDIDPLAASRSIYGNLVALFVYRKFFGSMTRLENLDQDLDHVVDIIMHGLAAGRK